MKYAISVYLGSKQSKSPINLSEIYIFGFHFVHKWNPSLNTTSVISGEKELSKT